MDICLFEGYIFFQVEAPATGRSPIQRSPNKNVWVIEWGQMQQRPSTATATARGGQTKKELKKAVSQNKF